MHPMIVQYSRSSSDFNLVSCVVANTAVAGRVYKWTTTIVIQH